MGNDFEPRCAIMDFSVLNSIHVFDLKLTSSSQVKLPGLTKAQELSPSPPDNILGRRSAFLGPKKYRRMASQKHQILKANDFPRLNSQIS